MLFDADLDEALQHLQGKAAISVVTDSANGAYVISANGRIHVATKPVGNLVDTTGAGDLFAAGFLFGFTQGHNLEECAKLGNFAAGEIIQHRGARPARPLKDLVA
jgi:sugar/nucleoside kinase (ribokinase family)